MFGSLRSRLTDTAETAQDSTAAFDLGAAVIAGGMGLCALGALTTHRGPLTIAVAIIGTALSAVGAVSREPVSRAIGSAIALFVLAATLMTVERGVRGAFGTWDLIAAAVGVVLVFGLSLGLQHAAEPANEVQRLTTLLAIASSVVALYIPAQIAIVGGPLSTSASIASILLTSVPLWAIASDRVRWVLTGTATAAGVTGVSVWRLSTGYWPGTFGGLSTVEQPRTVAPLLLVTAVTTIILGLVWLCAPAKDAYESYVAVTPASSQRLGPPTITNVHSFLVGRQRVQVRVDVSDSDDLADGRSDARDPVGAHPAFAPPPADSPADDVASDDAESGDDASDIAPDAPTDVSADPVGGATPRDAADAENREPAPARRLTIGRSAQPSEAIAELGRALLGPVASPVNAGELDRSERVLGSWVLFSNGRQVALDRPIVVGRSPQPTDPARSYDLVSVDDETLSLNHVVIGRDQAGPWIRDLNSTNGTFINPLTGVPRRLPADTRVPLSADDVIRFGRSWARFTIE